MFISLSQRFVRQSLVVGAVVAVLALILVNSAHAVGERKAITKSTKLGLLIVKTGDELVLQRGAKLTVDTLTVQEDASVRCENGPLDITVRKQLVVAGTLKCFRTTLAKNDIGNAILLTLQGSAIFEDTALVAANGHVQLVDSRGRLVNDARMLATYRNTFTKDDGAPIGIGPFLPKNAKKPQVKPVKKLKVPQGTPGCRDNNGNVVPNCIRVGGDWIVGPQGEVPPKRIEIPTPPKGIDRVILNYDFGGKDVEFQNDQVIIGPAGRPGQHDPRSGPARCTARGEDGGNAMDFKINARSVTFRNFILRLGDGGRGGNATTPECAKAKATGGNGGQAGNMNVRAFAAIRVLGDLVIYPGRGGDGGTAKAFGKKGDAGTTPPKSCLGGPGGTAEATGGNGADNIRELRARGVEGVKNVIVYGLIAGDGGSATARGGDGGDGITKGGPGGKASAIGGKGGVARFTRLGIVQPSPMDQSGKSGDAASSNGLDGSASGESCEKKPVIDDTPKPQLPMSFFQFFRIDELGGWTQQDTFPFGSKAHMIVRSDTVRIQEQLPITIRVTVNGERATTTVLPVIDPNTNVAPCGTEMMCSVDYKNNDGTAGAIPASWSDKRVLVEATGKDGALLASWKNY